LSFPKFGHPAAGWVALSPLLVALLAGAPGAFRLGLLTGIVYFAGTLYWLVKVMTTFGGLALPSAIGAAAVLVVYLSLYPALFAAVVARVNQRSRVAAVCLAPAVWVASELGRTYVWSGFPWVLLGYSQATVLPIAQLASVVGVYGLSFIVCSVSAALAYAVVTISEAPAARARALMTLTATVAAVLAVAAWGALRLRGSHLTREGEAIRVAVVQGNIAQEDKWNPALIEPILDRYITMSRAALGAGAGFIIWPESSTPFFFDSDRRGEAVRRLAAQSRVPFLIGSDEIEPAPQQPPRVYNAAFMVGPNGATAGVYRKMHLVPFGEYVPLKRMLFFVGPLVESVSDFSFGADPVTLPAVGRPVSVAICYEVIYSSLIRRFVLNGSQLLTTITNDAWYERSSAAYQHWEQASLRAIEQGRYLARAANTGISGFVDPYGRVLAQSELFEQTMLVADLRFIQSMTIYARVGDLVAWLSLAATAAALVTTSSRRS
jgi:apolipoprotein N-acyltransferase